jgi:hypothetical protein
MHQHTARKGARQEQTTMLTPVAATHCKHNGRSLARERPSMLLSVQNGLVVRSKCQECAWSCAAFGTTKGEEEKDKERIVIEEPRLITNRKDQRRHLLFSAVDY